MSRYRSRTRILVIVLLAVIAIPAVRLLSPSKIGEKEAQPEVESQSKAHSDASKQASRGEKGMSQEQFWSIIDKGKDSEDRGEALAEELVNMSPGEIASFQEQFDRAVGDAYRYDLWGAAYQIEGGCSDDGFEYFRYGLISRGSETYRKAMADPDSLADVDVEEGELSDELFGYVAMEVYEKKTGNRIPRTGLSFPETPSGEIWDFDDKAENLKRLPRLTTKYASIYAPSAPQPHSPPVTPKRPWYKFW